MSADLNALDASADATIAEIARLADGVDLAGMVDAALKSHGVAPTPGPCVHRLGRLADGALGIEE